MAALQKFINVTAFFYKLGESGSNFTFKENYRIPYKEDEFSSIKKMRLFIEYLKGGNFRVRKFRGLRGFLQKLRYVPRKNHIDRENKIREMCQC